MNSKHFNWSDLRQLISQAFELSDRSTLLSCYLRKQICRNRAPSYKYLRWLQLKKGAKALFSATWKKQFLLEFKSTEALKHGLLLREVTMATFGYTYAFGVYQDYYTASHLASETRISWIGSTQLFLIFFVGLPAGKMLDLGYYRHTMIAGAIIYVFSMFMVSLAHHDQYYQIFLSSHWDGNWCWNVYVPAVAIQAHYWQKRRALAMGVVVLGTSDGWNYLPNNVKRTLQRFSRIHMGSQSISIFVSGLLSVSLPTFLHGYECGAAIVAVGLYFPIFYLQLFTTLKGFDPNFAFYTLAIMNAAAFPGRIIPNFFADRIGPFNAESVGSIVVFAILYGFFSGAWLSLASPCVATLAKHPSELGVRFGISFAVSGIGALIGNPVDGALLGNTFPWWRAIVFSAVTVLGGNVLILYTRHFIAKNKGLSLFNDFLMM
ncbi:major facilitator superfamily domain-containing protein [Cyathus striatus]|nr:major facilitator superfamily domain-containing protein [Cyathus striatus]